MLDPWTSLSLAASIAQFIDFGAKVISEASEIERDGRSRNRLVVGDRADRVHALSSAITQRRWSKFQHGDLLNAEKVYEAEMLKQQSLC